MPSRGPRRGRSRNGAVRSLIALAESGSPGPAPSFAAPHILLVFLTVAGSNYVGRQSLARGSGLGEGATRTILRKLKEKGYLDVVRSGCYLTQSGKKLAASMRAAISDLIVLPRSGLTVGDHQAGLALPGAGGKVRSGIEQRDSAIRAGASGATTYVVKGGKFTIPLGSPDCERDFPGKAWSVLKRNLHPRDNDVVILCGAEDEVAAKLGALSAAITLL